MTEYYTDDNGARVLIRHKGPAGKGFPAGGTTGQILAKTSGTDYAATWVNPPDSVSSLTFTGTAPVDGYVAVFDGVTGLVVRSGMVAISSLATNTALALKVDKVTGKGLSTNDFTTVEKAKLTALSPAGYRGSFEDLAEINAYTFTPVPQDGDYCLAQAVGEEQIRYWWDSENTLWSSDAQVLDFDVDVAALALFPNADWTAGTSNSFTDVYKALVDSHESIISGFLSGGDSFQPWDATLTAFAAVTNGANKLAYFSGVDEMLTTDFTLAGRSIVGAVDAAAQRAVLGLGSAALADVSDFSVLSDVIVATATVSNTVTETTIFTGAVGAGTLSVGSLLKVRAGGVITNETASDDITIKLYMGATLLTTFAPAIGAVTGNVWFADTDITVRSIGASGTVAAWGETYIESVADRHSQINTVDTTVASDITVKVQWNNAKAGNLISIHKGWLETKK